MKKWCDHIIFDRHYKWWVLSKTAINSHRTIVVHDSWKVCPICEALRPTHGSKVKFTRPSKAVLA